MKEAISYSAEGKSALGGQPQASSHKFKTLLAITITLLIVFLIYSNSLNRDWQYFDEKIIFDEGIFPIPTTISETFEVISLYAFKYHTESQNAFFSNVINIRSNPLGAALYIIALFLFKKNFFLYHLLSLIIHLLCTVLVWLIFYRLYTGFRIQDSGFRSQEARSQKAQNLSGSKAQSLLLSVQSATCNPHFLFPTLLTLLWALHPVNTEAVLLGTNWSSLLNYLVCFSLFYYYLNKVLNKEHSIKVKEFLTISILFFVSTLISEYINILPFVLLLTTFAFNKSFVNSLKITSPLFIGSFIYLLYFFTRYFLLKPNDITIFTPVNISLERIFWFSPQIFFHFLNLFFYPKVLTPYQTNHVYLANNLFEPYSIFCFLVFLLFLILPIIVILLLKNKTKNIFSILTIYSFLASLFPFLHIISSTYCLVSDRYCYFSLFMFIFSLTSLIILVLNKTKLKTAISLLLIFAITFYSIRTGKRMNDWQNSFTLFSATINTFKDSLHKGFAYQVLGYYFDSTGNKQEMEKYMNLSIKNLSLAMDELKEKKNKNYKVPKTLIEYGLDTDSLILTSAFIIAYTKLNNFKESAKEVIRFYEPYIKDKLSTAGFSQIDLYAKLLIQTRKHKKAKEVLELAIKKYPFSPTIIYTLSNLYLYKLKDYNKAQKIIETGFYYYPSYRRILLRLIKLSETNKDLVSLAEYQYLLGLRIHSVKAYQRALQLFLQQKRVSKAKLTILKLVNLDKENPTTLLLVSNYFQLINQNEKVISYLNEAYNLANKHPEKIDIKVYKSILLNLINFNANFNNYPQVKKYIHELEQIITELTLSEKEYINSVKKKII